MEVVLSCSNLHRAYSSRAATTTVLTGVDLELRRGEVAAILGPSGSGKSTLLRLLAGLDRPDAGEIWWNGTAVHTRTPAQLAPLRSRTIGLVFQQHYLLEDLTARENISLPGHIRGERDDARASQLLSQVGLQDRADWLPEQLSGGEKQRVAVARALYDEPAILLADEPTGSLDRRNAAAVYALLVDLARSRGTAVLLVTHDEGLVSDVDSRYVLSEGRLNQLSSRL